MQDELKPIKEAEFDDALMMVPEEVQDFMWGEGFEFLLDTAQKAIALSDVEKQSMRITSYRVLLGLRGMEQETKRMLTEGIEPEKVTKMLYIIDTEILTRAQDIVQDAQQSDASLINLEVSTEIKSESSAPSPSDLLARLNQTMTTPSTLAPTKRVYNEPPTPQPSSLAPTGIKGIDPYRELPDK